MRVREVPPKEVVERRLLFRDPEGAERSFWTRWAWITRARERFFSEVG